MELTNNTNAEYSVKNSEDTQTIVYDYDEKQPLFSAPFSIYGRIRRLEFCLSYFLYIMFTLLASKIGFYFYLIVMILGFWFMTAQGAKRCHDRNNSGWYQFIPFYGLWMLFADGDVGENDYGPDPKGRKLEK